MGRSKNKGSADTSKLASQYAQQQAVEQQRLDSQRLQYDQERQQLLGQLNAQQQQQQGAQTRQQELLATQNAQQLAQQTNLIDQLKQQYEAQNTALTGQLSTYGELSGQQDKQNQYLSYLQTQAGVQANEEQANLRDRLLKSTKQNEDRQGILSQLTSKRVSSRSPEYVRGGTISSSKLLR